ncbi:MAG: S-adenosylmethionine decarboxylase [Deltaproteobacteria bacterium]|nr:S-adenosylmethionine decarboxylase [Deltaproteobacteria bacterium]
MLHFTMDGFGGHRSRFDDIRLIHELLEELPARLGLKPAMPPMLLPYYNGVEPDDCGISAFLFLPGGHLTLHTFSFRECYFVDLVAPRPFDVHEAQAYIANALPVRSIETHTARRPRPFDDVPVHPDEDFGPHLLLNIEGYTGPTSMDGLFQLFDNLPPRIDMTPIMRPYVLRSMGENGQSTLSAMTMIAESHIALHIEEGTPGKESTGRAYFDIFSCKFFDTDAVLGQLKAAFPGQSHTVQLISRGCGYTVKRTERAPEHARTKAWLTARPA